MFKTIKKDLIYYFITFGFLRGTSFLLLPIYSHALSPHNYGMFVFMIAILNFLSIISEFGFTNYLYKNIKQKKRDKFIIGNMIAISFLLNVVIFLMLTILLSLNLTSYDINKIDISFLMISLIFTSLSMILLTKLRIYNQSKEFFIISILQPLLNLFFIFILRYYEIIDIRSIVITIMFSNIIQFIVIYLYQRKEFVVNLKISFSKKIIKYSYGTIFSVLALYVLTGFDKIFLSYYITSDKLADYSILMLVSSLVIICMEPISLWFFSNRFSLLKTNKKKYDLFLKSLIELNIIIMTLVIFFAENIFYLLAPEIYNFSFEFIIISAFAFHFKYLSTILNIGLFLEKTTNKIAIINTIVSLIVLSLYFILPKEIIYVAISIMVGYLMILIINIYYSNRKVSIKMNKFEIFIFYFVSFLIMFEKGLCL